MQERHLNKNLYFEELSTTSEEFYIPYLNDFISLTPNLKILEIGCGVGGNLLPFAKLGCKVVGIDFSVKKIDLAKEIFKNFNGEFVADDFFMIKPEDIGKFDIILVHDVIEHINNKDSFIKHAIKFADENTLFFWRFPAWRMPFGGHQQICKSKILSHFPYIHLLPMPLYRSILNIANEKTEELTDIKRCKVSINMFENLMRNNKLLTIDRTLWFINPHYKQKFNLKPRKLYKWFSKVSYFRDFFSTSCYYLTKEG